jgi:hypothetical protein
MIRRTRGGCFRLDGLTAYRGGRFCCRGVGSSYTLSHAKPRRRVDELAPDGTGWTSLGAAWNRVNTSEFAGTSRLPLDTLGVDLVTLNSRVMPKKKPAPHGGSFIFECLLP